VSGGAGNREPEALALALVGIGKPLALGLGACLSGGLGLGRQLLASSCQLPVAPWGVEV